MKQILEILSRESELDEPHPDRGPSWMAAETNPAESAAIGVRLVRPCSHAGICRAGDCGDEAFTTHARPEAAISGLANGSHERSSTVNSRERYAAEREADYQATLDVEYEVWRSGGDPDSVNRDRVQSELDQGYSVDEIAGMELQSQRRIEPENE